MTYEPFHLGTKKHVFIDWSLIEPGYGLTFGGSEPESWEIPYGIKLSAHLPQLSADPLVKAEQPWEGGNAKSGLGVYNTLLEDEGTFKLYYDAGDMSGELDVDEDLGTQRVLAYAESTDGVNWTKPNIGTTTFRGSKENNLVYGLDASPGRDSHGATVFKDPSAPADERYKIVSIGTYEGRFCIFGGVSPDGLKWKLIEKPLVPQYLSDVQGIVRFDEEKGKYVGYYRGWTAHEHGTSHARRIITYSETEDFANWPRPRPLVTASLHDSPDTDVYTNSYNLWPNADAHVMFPALYHHNEDYADVHMMTSRDGQNWQRPLTGPILAAGEPGTPSVGSFYAGHGLVSLKPGEWSTPVTPRRASHNTVFFDDSMEEPGVHAATWREDGFMSLDAESHGGCTTLILDFDGSTMKLNTYTRLGGEVLVEISDASNDNRRVHGPALPGRSFEDCDVITGDHVSKTVTWKGESDLSAWTGKPVRVRFRMRRAKLYAMSFV